MKGIYTPDSVNTYLSTWLAAGEDASVCVHSQSGYRAGNDGQVVGRYTLDFRWRITT